MAEHHHRHVLSYPYLGFQPGGSGFAAAVLSTCFHLGEGTRHEDLHFLSGTAVGLLNSDKATPKTVVIPDLHRVAQALRAPFDHVDMPASMLAVFAAGEGREGVPVEQAARTFHERLVRRIASWRSAWLDQAWFGALTGAMMDVAAVAGESAKGNALPVVAAALLVGRKVVVASAPGARACLMAGAAPDGCSSVSPLEMDGSVCCFQQLPNRSPGIADTLCIPIALLAGFSRLEDGATCSAVSRHLDPSGLPSSLQVKAIAPEIRDDLSPAAEVFVSEETAGSCCGVAPCGAEGPKRAYLSRSWCLIWSPPQAGAAEPLAAAAARLGFAEPEAGWK